MAGRSMDVIDTLKETEAEQWPGKCLHQSWWERWHLARSITVIMDLIN